MLIRGDARALPLRDGSVACVVTSPPYWGLRTYGDDRQLGLEPTPEAYVASLVQVFREVRRVLRDDGTLWLNLGDSYTTCFYSHDSIRSVPQPMGDWCKEGQRLPKSERTKRGAAESMNGLKPKDLVGIPWRVAFALQTDGWYLRSDIIWAKPNPMPESVTDRPTKAHEYLFLLSKRERYYYDAAAIHEIQTSHGNGGFSNKLTYKPVRLNAAHKPSLINAQNDGKRNKRTVWQIATEPYSGAHFATFPEALVEPCILAGCPLGGRVLDPFCGTGTVLAVAERLGRRGVGVDLAYQALAAERTAQRGLPFSECAAIGGPL